MRPKYKLGKNQGLYWQHLKDNSPEVLDRAVFLQSDFLAFAKFFFKVITGGEYLVPQPLGKKSHIIEIVEAFTNIYEMKASNTMIWLPPRTGKSFLAACFIAWTFSLNPYANFIYISFVEDVALQMSDIVRTIMMSKEYQLLYGIKFREDTSSRHWMMTEDGGTLNALGAGGAITSKGAGMSSERDIFGGCILIDDPHNPKEYYVRSDESDKKKEWYDTRVCPRVNNSWTPTILIGHRTGINDLHGRILDTAPEGRWTVIKAPAIYEYEGKEYSFDEFRFPLESKIGPPYIEGLYEKQKVIGIDFFESLYQQNPQLSSGQVIRPDDIFFTTEDPKMIFTFIVGDTAYKSGEKNDHTAFGFFGMYKTINPAEPYACHCIDCINVKVEARDLEATFFDFYTGCCRHAKKPSFICIEDQGSGTYLISLLKKYQGLIIHEVKRNRKKLFRFAEMGAYFARKLISFTKGKPHVAECINQLIKINKLRNNAEDDIADVFYDAIRICFLEESYRHRYGYAEENEELNKAMKEIYSHAERVAASRRASYQHDWNKNYIN